MSAANSRKLLMLVVVMAMAGALVIAGCGGSGGTTSAEQNPPSNETPATEAVGSETESGAEGGESMEGGSSEAMEEEGGAEGEAMGEEESMSEGGEEAGAAGGEEGKTVFTTNCGSCHTLSAAGTTGTVGPNLDELMPSESIVEMQVINGGGPMPAFGNEGILSEEEIKAVSAYVSSEAGK
jgi:cytochrome c6